MSKEINLKGQLLIDGKAVKTVTLDFDALTGFDLTAAELDARTAGENNPIINFSQKYHAAIAAKALGLKMDDILALNAKDYLAITNEVGNFLQGIG